SDLEFENQLKAGESPNVAYKNGASIMSYVVANTDSRYLALTLKYSGDPNLYHESRKRNIIFGAVSPGHIPHLKLLIKAGADVNVRNGSGNTPLISAASLNQYDAAYLLLENGADPSIKNNWGKGVADRIAGNNISSSSHLYQWRSKVIKKLEQQGIKIPNQE
ncbi:MAG: ankyrin repeat domain-containing protein, partial [Cellvibrionaceae bacterium]|nr:ankyrin repeat domain-containing protein [Cellvibrionaceae bacterium]